MDCVSSQVGATGATAVFLEEEPAETLVVNSSVCRGLLVATS